MIANIQKIVNNDDFDIDRNLKIVNPNRRSGKWSTNDTLIDLEYDNYDLIDELCSLTIGDYSESRFDQDDSNPLILYIFGKKINNKLVYIKFKIREGYNNKQIICLSFHYAEWDMNFPYKT